MAVEKPVEWNEEGSNAVGDDVDYSDFFVDFFLVVFIMGQPDGLGNAESHSACSDYRTNDLGDQRHGLAEQKAKYDERQDSKIED